MPAERIRLVSTATKKNAKGKIIKTGCMRVTKKNKKQHPEKMEKKMYDWVVRKHVIFKEEKMK